MGDIRAILMDAGEGFIADECLTRGAGIAYFTLFSVGPLLFIVTGIAGLMFDRQQIDSALVAQLTGIVGERGADEVKRMADGALGDARGGWALAIGLVTLLITASGAFASLQSALNAIWKAEIPEADSIVETVSRLVKARAAALGLVGATGFVMIASLAVSAAISSLASWLESALPGGAALALLLNTAVTVAILTILFAAIFRVLPDRKLDWRDVFIGAFVTAILFSIGKWAISVYIGFSSIDAGFGAAGALIILLVWIYYSALIFLAGAEFTRAWANRHGSRRTAPIPARSDERAQPT
ncbi:YihY/virulence factor BrkB family protein [Elioraea rosea]|uniref:YihY/virulence factor BrkB family protein n=1 Tax=Elioraea rosea TaxID=2492390 RepID=UPI001184075A|nr:YihY/virulence factor BrkB family protein [Elioraea rosea]